MTYQGVITINGTPHDVEWRWRDSNFDGLIPFDPETGTQVLIPAGAQVRVGTLGEAFASDVLPAPRS